LPGGAGVAEAALTVTVFAVCGAVKIVVQTVEAADLRLESTTGGRWIYIVSEIRRSICCGRKVVAAPSRHEEYFDLVAARRAILV
jgi:hypothetical protein